MTAIHEILAKNQTVEQFISALDCDYDTNLFDSVMSLDQQASLKAARNEEMEKKERDVRVKKFRQQKAGKLEETLEKIKALLDPRWKEFVLNKHYYSNDGWTRFRDFPGESGSQSMHQRTCLTNLIHSSRKPRLQSKI
jgi:hypothetical protein